MIFRNPLLASLLLALVCQGCSLFDWSEEEHSHGRMDSVRSGSRVGIEKAPEKVRLTDVEVTWEIPNDPVDGFIIRYGFDPDRLTNSAKVTPDDLQKFEDKSHGFVYRYLIKDVPASRSLFISIAAYRGSEVSPPSDVFRVNPGTGSSRSNR